MPWDLVQCARVSIGLEPELPVSVSYSQGWQPAFTAGIIRRLKPDKAGPDNTPKSGFYRLLVAFTIFLPFSTTKTVLTILYVY